MSAGPVYVLDANVFIEAARRYYAFDIVPVYWDTLVDRAKAGRVLSIDRVKKEIERGKDDLAKWVKTVFYSWFDSTNQPDVIAAYQAIIKWVVIQTQFKSHAKAQFASGADGWLVAYAMAKGCTVVTHEKFSLDAQNKVPIPNVCKAFNVPYVDTFAMLRNLGVKFSR